MSTAPQPERPMPTPTRESQAYWDGLREGKLMLQHPYGGLRRVAGATSDAVAKHGVRCAYVDYHYRKARTARDLGDLRALPALEDGRIDDGRITGSCDRARGL